MRDYDASTPVELSVTAGDDMLSTLFSVGGTGDVVDATIGNVINAAVITYYSCHSHQDTDPEALFLRFIQVHTDSIRHFLLPFA